MSSKYTLLDFAEDVLRQHEGPLSYRDIWERGCAAGLDRKLDLHGQNHAESLGSCLHENVRKQEPRFEVADRDPIRYALRKRANMRSPSRPLVVSVESRKGGVGKTTAALNLAKLLSEEGYRTLFVDADITGTDASSSLDGSFWDKRVTVAEWCNRDGKAVRANLLDVFTRHYLAGRGVPEFRSTIHPTDACFLLRDADGDASRKQNRQIALVGSLLRDGKDTGRARSPGVLLDELHSFWFVSFLQELCLSFWRWVQTCESPGPVAVVIDNSPGYVGVAPAIHSWLADLGPEDGKFLTVASLDRQDLQACLATVEQVEQQMTERARAAQMWSGTQKTHHVADTTQLTRDFLLRLLEASPVDNTNLPDFAAKGLSFFKEGGATKKRTGISDYQALLINAVPQHVKAGALDYDFGDIVSPDEEAMSGLLPFRGGSRSRGSAQAIEETQHVF